MKFRSLISALIVFTLVLTCAVSAVSANNVGYKTTTTYSATEVTVTTDVTGLSENSMVSYVIYDDSETNVPNDGNIKYIDQDTASNGSVSFTITDTVAKLNGKKILMGSNLDTLTATNSGVDDYVVPEASSDLIVTYDDEVVVDEKNNSVTFLVHQNIASKQTGINVVAKVNDEEYVFNNLVNLAVKDDVYEKYYAIQLVDETNTIDFSACTFEVTPVVNGTEMTNISGSNYWIETVAGN